MSERERRRIREVVVVGAGPAGAAAATHLAREGVDVVLVDRASFPRDKPCAEALSPAADPLLAELGVLDEIEAAHPARLRGFRIYAPGGGIFQGDYAATRDAEGNSSFETGLSVPRTVLDAAIVGAARLAGAEVREGWRMDTLERADGAWRLGGPGGETIRARLLIAADGVHSTVARRLGLHAPGRLRKIALVAHIRGIIGLDSHGEMHVARRRYAGLARLEPPDRGDRCNVAMVVDERRDGPALKGHPDAFLLEALATFPRLRDRLGAARIERRALVVSRMHVRARRLADDGLLLVGDAAGYLDPFTGQGIHTALASAGLAATVAAEALRADDLSHAKLSAYDRAYRRAAAGKRVVEVAIQAAVWTPPLMDHVARRLARHKGLADTLMAVTGDYLPASAVLRPGYLARLLV